MLGHLGIVTLNPTYYLVNCKLLDNEKPLNLLEKNLKCRLPFQIKYFAMQNRLSFSAQIYFSPS